ncbi:MAG: hypothetical protein QOJ97_666 [Solirubrobacteraceae bacterium]|jgi:hypothetical protein|nr:hypothetical protein [Solirubrobacteraceae bacterium]
MVLAGVAGAVFYGNDRRLFLSLLPLMLGAVLLVLAAFFHDDIFVRLRHFEFRVAKRRRE